MMGLCTSDTHLTPAVLAMWCFLDQGDEWEGMKQRALDRYDERLHEDYLWGAM